MRGLSAGAMLYASILVAVLLWGPLTDPAAAQAGITVGFAVDGSGLVTSPEIGENVGRYLEDRLSLPVKVLNFAAEDQLQSGFVNFYEVDVAWLSDDFLGGARAGQVYLLARSLDHFPEPLHGEIVARQELDHELRKKVLDAFLTMHESSSGKILLSQLRVSRFVSSLGDQRSDSSATIESQVLEQSQSVVVTGDPASTSTSASVDVSLVVPGQASRQEDSAPAQPVEMKEERPLAAVDKESGGAISPLASPEIDQAAPIALLADYLAYNPEEDSYEAKGNVVLRQGDVELKSEELLWQSATQDAAAQGSVSLVDTDTEVFGERLQYNMATGQGQVRDGRVFVHEGNFRLVGEQVEKHGQTGYFVKQGSFTTCDGEIPDWKFSASEVDVTLGGYARAKNVLFHIRDVPVLYTPYLMFPVKTERESGLLMPAFGYSNTKGTRASLAWYQVVDRNMDATVYLDYLSEIGLGKGLEYRYALANQNNGEALYYHVTGFSETPDLYYLEWQHHGNLPYDWHLTADVEYASEKRFFEEFGEVAEDYNRDKTVSTLMLRRNWQKLNLVGHARYIKDLEADSDGVLQRLPELGLGLARYRLGDTPFYAGIESYATRFWQREGEDGDRLYLKPSLSAVFMPGSWLEIVPEVALYERLYNSETEDDEKSVPEFTLALATRLVKGFDVNDWGVDRIQHSVEPQIIYAYVPDVSQEGLPQFDLYDRIERRNDIVYALVNRLTARSTAADGSSVYREFFNLRLSQNYDIDEERHNRSGKHQPFSDVRVEMDFRPTPKVSLDLDSWIPVYGDTHFRALSVGTSVNDGFGNGVKVNYVYKDEEFYGAATDYARLQLDTVVLKPVYLRFEERYDFQENLELEKVLSLEYRSKCWSILLTYRDRYRDDGDDDQEVMVTFVLAGLGQGQGFGSGL